MAGYVLIGALAAFGLLCVLWIGYGFFLPKAVGGVIVYPGNLTEQGMNFTLRCIWLREMGLLHCPLIAVEDDLNEGERIWLTSHGIEICSREELSNRLGIGENGF